MSKAAPLSNEKRTENYKNDNNGAPLTMKQKRNIRKAERRAKKALKDG